MMTSLKNPSASTDTPCDVFKTSRGRFKKFKRSVVHSVVLGGMGRLQVWTKTADKSPEEIDDYAKAEGFIP